MSTIQTQLRESAASPLVRRLSAIVPLEDEGVRALETLTISPRDYPKSAELIELLMRMERAGLAEGSAFHAPLTLSTLADLLGMTLEHVSRLMQRLRRSGLVRTDRDRIEIVDIDALAKECDFDPSYLHRSEQPKPLQPQ